MYGIIWINSMLNFSNGLKEIDTISVEFFNAISKLYDSS
jgi:hypothetical protein